MRLAKFRKTSWLAQWQIHEVVSIAAVTAVVSFLIPFLRVNSGELVSNLFRECEEIEGGYYGLCKSSGYAWTGIINLIYFLVFLLLFSAALKLCFMTLTFGIRVPAGVFVPSLVVGGMVGRAFGIGMQLLQESYPKVCDWLSNHKSIVFSSCLIPDRCVTPGTYAMVGAASMLAGVTRMTVSLVVIMFELTGSLSYS